jgi:virginiamycin B lyase
VKTLSPCFAILLLLCACPAWADVVVEAYPLPKGEYPHDVAPGPGWRRGVVHGAAKGMLGRLDPATRKIEEVPLGPGSAPPMLISGK